MRGDTSDNLPGLRGIGEKRAEELLQKYHDIESIYRAVKKHPEDFKPGVLTALQNGEKEVPLSKKMVTIVRDLDIDFKMTDAAVKPPDLETLRKVFADFEFHSLMARFDKEAGTSPATESKSESGGLSGVGRTARLPTAEAARVGREGSPVGEASVAAAGPDGSP
jgi:DNA polymerase-1